MTGLGVARAAVQKWLVVPDLDVVDVILGTVLANTGPGDPVWVLIVGPPSSAKSELLRALAEAPYTFRLASLTGKTLVSGHREANGGLLFRIPDKSTMVLLDFGQVLSLHPNDKALVLQRLREVCDGYTRGDFGNRSDGVEWKGKLGFLAGCTPAVERYTSVVGELGDRFLLYGLDVANPGGQAADALNNSGHESEMRRELSRTFAEALNGAGDPGIVTLPSESRDALISLSCMTARLRTPVVRDRFSKDIEYIPQPEGPARLAKALFTLGKAIAALRGRDHVGEGELRTLARISMRSISSKRSRVVRALIGMEGGTTKAIGLAAGLATATTGYILEDLHCLDAADRWVESDAETAPFHWRLKPEVEDQLTRALALTGEQLHTQKLIDRRENIREDSLGQSKRPSHVFACEARRESEESEPWAKW